MKVSIVGAGWVGKAMKELFPDAYVYHPDRESDVEVRNARRKANEADVAFICVPTPNEKGIGKELGNGKTIEPYEGKLDTSIVEECIAWLQTPLIVIRSTVNPGDCDRWTAKYRKQIIMQPEYLGETPEHPMLNQKTRPFIIMGGLSYYNNEKFFDNTRKLIQLYQTTYNANVTIRQVANLEAEIIKLSENRAIAYKVAQCQELYDVCEKAGVDYYTIRDAVYGDDPRFNLWWTFVFPDNRGFNSKCIPKDVYAWCAWAESLGYEPNITRALLEKNKEWIGGE